MRRIALAVVVLALSCVAFSEELNVAAAADLNFALPEIAKKFEQQTGNQVKISFGSSGNFFTQIQNGAPFDLFFSADTEFPKKLEAAGLAEPGTIYCYAIGRLVLWVTNGSKLDLSAALKVLLDPAVKKIAIANPKHAPYGRAAEAALRNAGIYEQVASKLVVGENISQTAQFVDTGNADVGIVAMSLALSPTMKQRGRYVEVPAELYPRLEQSAVVLRSSQKKLTAKQFLEFLGSTEAQAVMKKYGFE
jgi:molybdate transport system substrate-binding protein